MYKLKINHSLQANLNNVLKRLRSPWVVFSVLCFQNAPPLPLRLGDVRFVPRLHVAASKKRENNCCDHAQSGCYHENVSPLRHRLLHIKSTMSPLVNKLTWELRNYFLCHFELTFSWIIMPTTRGTTNPLLIPIMLIKPSRDPASFVFVIILLKI